MLFQHLGVWAQNPTIYAFSICSCPCPWKGKWRIHQWRQDKHIIETSRNCYCQRFVSMHEKEKSIKLSIILSGGCGRPSGCPGQHDAPVQKLNAMPALPSSSPTVDFPPLYLTWARKPAQQNIHNATLCLISSVATNLICTRNWEIAGASVITGLDWVECELLIVQNRGDGESKIMGKEWRLDIAMTLILCLLKYPKWWKPSKTPTALHLYRLTGCSHHMPTAFLFSGLRSVQFLMGAFSVTSVFYGNFFELLLHLGSWWYSGGIIYDAQKHFMLFLLLSCKKQTKNKKNL